MLPSSLKCVVIGDDGIGKSSLVRRFILDDFSPQYVPTAQDDYTVYKRLHKASTSETGSTVSHKITVNICDTGGQSDLDRLRPLCYSKVDVVMVCFSVVNPASFKNITSKWLPEIKRHTVNNNVPVVLVGTQADLRSNLHILLSLKEDGHAPVSEARALKLAKKIGAQNYVECSAVTKTNVKQAFDMSLIWGLRRVNKLQLLLSDSETSMPTSASAPTPPSAPASISTLASETQSEKEQSKNVKAATITDKSFICGSDSVFNVITNVTNCGASSNLLSRQRRTNIKKHSKLKRLLFMSCFPV